jgi:hypothetical protein
MDTFAKVIEALVNAFVNGIVVPVTSVIPRLVSSGALLATFSILWLAIGAAAVANPAGLDATWRAIGEWPLPAQAIGWLLFLPVTAGMWIWATDWPLAARVVLVVSLAGWNLLVFIPRREQPAAATATES